MGKGYDQGLIEDFISCVKEGREPSITGEDGFRALEVVKAAYQSSNNKKLVELDRIDL
ncbi:Gfo/Idh/MocA family oxidoreductase [Gracilibacillus sp. JCM 18860]|uniref:Gfo/Idh/MocA family oxidoreductase n=1 Tax=Gracilibacillus sp. JCM 18860 TaxID=1306159 RepID=UPI0032610ECA